jgi:hypothetical protein
MLAAGGVDGCSAGPGREVVTVGEADHVAESARIRAAPAGPMPWMSIRFEPAVSTAAWSSAFMVLSLR